MDDRRNTPPCGGSVSLIASNPSFADLTTASLQGWSCSVHKSFPTFRDDWSALAVATDTPSHPTCGVDPGTGSNACGEAYILIAGSSIVVNSLVISVSPLDDTNPVGTSHTVTANVHAAGGAPVVAGQLVDFTVTGQNAGASGTCVPADCKSDVNGNVAFTYSDGNGAGDDTIKASFTDTAGSLQTATAQKHWVAVATKSTSTTYTGGASVQYSDSAALSGTLLDTSGVPVGDRRQAARLHARYAECECEPDRRERQCFDVARRHTKAGFGDHRGNRVCRRCHVLGVERQRPVRDHQGGLHARVHGRHARERGEHDEPQGPVR